MSKLTNFDSRHPDFHGLDAWYRQDLYPDLVAREKQRQEAVKLFTLSLIGVGVIGLIIYIYYKTKTGFAPPVFPYAFVALGGVALVWWPLGRFKRDIEKLFLPLIAQRLGLIYSAQVPEPVGLDICQQAKLLPEFAISDYAHLMRGQRRDRDYVIYEAHLEVISTGKSRSTRTVFHGQIIRLHYPARFQGETVIRRDRMIANKLTRPRKGMKQVGMASPNFEKTYEVWSTDQVEARDLLDPIVLERFIELDRLYQGGNVQAAFIGEYLYLTIQNGNRMNFGSIFKPLAAPERISNILTEIAAIYDLLDIIQKPVNGQMQGAFGVKHVRG